MAKTACTVPITQIILDEDIYPREGVSPKRVSMFAENMRDGFEIDPIEVQIHPECMGIKSWIVNYKFLKYIEMIIKYDTSVCKNNS